MAAQANIATILQILFNALDPWAQQNNAGRAFIASSTQEMWSQAANSTQRGSVIICFEGDEARGPFETASATHRGDFRFNVVLIRVRGLTANRGDSLVSPVQNARPFYVLVEEVRDIIRSITNISLEDFVDYKGSEPYEETINDFNRTVDAQKLSFSVAQDYPQLTSTPPNQILPI